MLAGTKTPKKLGPNPKQKGCLHHTQAVVQLLETSTAQQQQTLLMSLHQQAWVQTLTFLQVLLVSFREQMLAHLLAKSPGASGAFRSSPLLLQAEAQKLRNMLAACLAVLPQLWYQAAMLSAHSPQLYLKSLQLQRSCLNQITLSQPQLMRLRPPLCLMSQQSPSHLPQQLPPLQAPQPQLALR